MYLNNENKIEMTVICPKLAPLFLSQIKLKYLGDVWLHFLFYTFKSRKSHKHDGMKVIHPKLTFIDILISNKSYI